MLTVFTCNFDFNKKRMIDWLIVVEMILCMTLTDISKAKSIVCDFPHIPYFPQYKMVWKNLSFTIKSFVLYFSFTGNNYCGLFSSNIWKGQELHIQLSCTLRILACNRLAINWVEHVLARRKSLVEWTYFAGACIGISIPQHHRIISIEMWY